jgi:hypothetical protein
VLAADWWWQPILASPGFRGSPSHPQFDYSYPALPMGSLFVHGLFARVTTQCTDSGFVWPILSDCDCPSSHSGVLAHFPQVPAGPDCVQLPDRCVWQGAHAGRHGPRVLQAAQLGPPARPLHVHQRHHQLPHAAALRRGRKCTRESTPKTSGGAV